MAVGRQVYTSRVNCHAWRILKKLRPTESSCHDRARPRTDRRRNATTLLVIEAIKQLKARYCRLPRHQGLGGVAGDLYRRLRQRHAEAGGKLIIGADDFVAFTRNGIGRPSQSTAHQVHAPEIELTSATTARGVWALQDVVRFGPGVTLGGLRPLPRNLREHCREVAYQELQANSAARGHRHSGVLALYLRPYPEGSGHARRPTDGTVNVYDCWNHSGHRCVRSGRQAMHPDPARQWANRRRHGPADRQDRCRRG